MCVMRSDGVWWRGVWCVLLLAVLSWGCGGDTKTSAPGTGDSDDVADAGDGDDRDAASGEDAEDEQDAVVEPMTDEERILAVPETELWELPELNLSAEAYVVRTEMNVPHVYAQNRLDMGKVLGFVVARDRFFIMDLQRRLTQGTISALLGDLGLSNDIESRLLGMSTVARLVERGLSEEDRAFMQAYADGINAYIAQVAAGAVDPPSEYASVGGLLVPGSAPADLMAPFEVKDVAAMVAVIMFETNFESGDIGRQAKFERFDEIFADEATPLRDLRLRGAREDIRDNLRPLFPVASVPDWDGSFADDGGGSGSDDMGGAPRPAPPGVARRLKMEPRMMARAQARLDRLKVLFGRKEADNFGSNTWAVAGDRSADGAALVAGDGHLPLYVPSLMYQVGLNTRLFGGDIHEAGLLITSLPVMAVGTNGDIAWSQVNPVADIVDWYLDELILDEDGAPTATRFQGEARPLETIEETFNVAQIDFFDSVGRSLTIERFRTFDGRFVFDVEGRPLAEGEDPGPGEYAVTLPGGRVVPEDMDDDGRITALSFDTPVFDTTGYINALVGFTRARSVEEYLEFSKGLVGNMLYAAVADQSGSIAYASYQAVPCRTYLPRDEDGHFMPGADPTMLIDGTQYQGFTMPTLPDGKVDESQGEDDPYRCVVPFDANPQVIDPAQGFVVNANNQPAPWQDDGRIDDDPWYLGGPWSSVRADSIAGQLELAIQEGTADTAKMAEIQAYTRSRLGEVFAPHFIAAIERARSLSETDGLLEAHEQRLVDLYLTRDERFSEVAERLSAWQRAGFETPAGVDTFYRAVAEGEQADAVATMIFNAWLPRFINAVFNDEGMDAAFRFSRSRNSLWALDRFLKGRGAQQPADVASWNPDTGESVFFDVLNTPEVERSEEVILASLAEALDFLSGEPDGPDTGGFGTEDMDQWLWGLRHQVRFESLLADFLPGDSSLGFLTDLFSITTRTLPLSDAFESGDPRARLKWFPRPGDNFSVDASNPGFSGTRFTHGSGPVMRMVIALKEGQVSGLNVVPGGQSGLFTSDHFADQAGLWLGNQALPLRYHVRDVAQGAVGREVYR